MEGLAWTHHLHNSASALKTKKDSLQVCCPFSREPAGALLEARFPGTPPESPGAALSRQSPEGAPGLVQSERGQMKLGFQDTWFDTGANARFLL